MNQKVLIIGKGKVGQATGDSLNCEVGYHDPYKQIVEHNVNRYDFVIVCVDSLQSGPKDYKDLLSVIEFLDSNKYSGTVAIRSTVHPDFMSYVENKKYSVLFFPEFLVQRDNYFKEQSPWIAVVGGPVAPRQAFISFLYNCGYIDDMGKTRGVSSLEAIIAKLAANAALATKVLTFNSIYGICDNFNIDYETVRDIVVSDQRIGKSHTIVPSPDDGKLGFGGHCLPKDILAISDIDRLLFFQAVSSINAKLREMI